MNKVRHKSMNNSYWIRRWTLLAALLMGFAVPVQANAQKIIEISIEGNQRVLDKTIEAALSFKKGDNFSPDLVTKNLRAIWDKGFFKDIQILKETTPDGVKLNDLVQEKPSIRKVIYEGNDEVSKEDIEEVVNVKPLKILNIELLKTNAEKIRELYVDKGFFLADVDYKVVPVGDDGQRVDVTFLVEENFKVQVRRINIVGNDFLTDAQIKAMIQTREGNEISFITKSGTFKEEHFQTDLMRIQAFITITASSPLRWANPR